MIKFKVLTAILVFTTFIGYGQNEKPVADKISAVVGDEIILKSDIEKQLQNFPGDSIPEATKRCKILAKSIENKLLITKAKEDSIRVKPQQVENELNRRIQYFVRQIGSQSKLEQYYDKSITEIKEEMRQPIREMLLRQRMQSKLISGVQVTPKEVKQYFRNLPDDSIPYFNTQVQIGQIVRVPEPPEAEKRRARKRLEELRKRIVEEGESFDNLAILYSDDQASATKGGDLGMRNKNSFNDRFAAAAMQLAEDSVSQVIKSQDGYHIIKLLERKGDKIHVKHILKKPEITPKARKQTQNFLDSVRRLIMNDSMTFKQAAYKFSADKDTRNNGGLITNKQTGSTKIPVKQLNSEMFFNIDTMKVGSISQPVPMNFKSLNDAYRIVYLKSRTPPHRANLNQDYTRIRRQALQQAKKRKMQEWYKKYARNTYIKINSNDTDCKEIRPYLPRQ